MLKFAQWPDPHDVCEGEYSVIYEFFNDLLMDNDEEPEMIRASLNEFIEWATYLRNEMYEDFIPRE
jgi:hypothetical protein